MMKRRIYNKSNLNNILNLFCFLTIHFSNMNSLKTTFSHIHKIRHFVEPFEYDGFK